MNKKSIFITGGAGYVGSRLVPMLLDKGYVVTVYDILYFGDEFLPKNNPNLKVIKGDLRDYDKLKKVVRIMKFLFIWHVFLMTLVSFWMKKL